MLNLLTTRNFRYLISVEMPGEMCVKISIKNDSIDNGLGVYYRTSDGNTEAPPPPHEEEEEKNGKNILYVCMYILYDVFSKDG